MDEFVCDVCATVDVIEVAYTELSPPQPGGQWRCTKCQTGVWHDHFPQRKYQPQEDLVVNRPNGVGLG